MTPSRTPAPLRLVPLAVLLIASSPCPAGEEPFPEPAASGLALVGDFRLKGEIKFGFRNSQDLVFKYTSASVGPVQMETPSPGSSFDLQTINFVAAGNITDRISAKVEVHVLDLYNRNPTSRDDRVALREAWIRFGRKDEVLKPIPGTSFYLEAGKFPRFSKQVDRRLESYGLWGTAVGRFEEVGLEAGGSIGQNVYWRGQVVNGNPLFMRDVNALAGDNGTEENPADTKAEPTFYTGFPILYDAKATDVNFSQRVQVGGGLGFRLTSADGARGLDFLVWGFRRELQDSVPIRGSYYRGDLDLLDGFPPPEVTFSGRTKWEAGANLEARTEALRLFGQFVYQDIAGLVRTGFEAEAGWRFELNGLFAWGDSPVFNWVQPDVRYSEIRNDFTMPAGFIAPQFAWDWQKLDVGLRLGIVRGVDLTAEYTRHWMKTRGEWLHADELLVTLRAGF